MLNEYGMRLDKNGYARSVLQDDTCRCCRCGRTDRKLDRHEVWGGANRQKSKALGLWVTLCHEDCHEGPNGVHQDAELRRKLRELSQEIAMDVYGWSEKEFVRRFGKSYTSSGAARHLSRCGSVTPRLWHATGMSFTPAAPLRCLEGKAEGDGVFCVLEEAELPW